MPAFRVSPSPSWRPLAWLVQPPKAASAETLSGLRDTLFRRMSSLTSGALVGLMVNAIVLSRCPVLPVFVWSVVDLSLVLCRFVIIARLMRMLQGPADAIPERSRLVDAFVASSVLWCAQIGVGGFLCMFLGDLILSVYGSLLVTGIVCALGARNPGSPRMVRLQMVLIIVPFSAGAMLAPEPWLAGIGILAPICLWGMISINTELHADYFRMLTAEEETRRLALNCGLTGLLNRTGFNRRLEALMRGASPEPISMLFLDLDGFKAVNDQQGHAAGDALLAETGERIRQIIPPSATAARLGGDEFAIFIPDDGTGVDALADSLIAALSRPYALPEGVTARAGVSIGSSTCRSGVSDLTLLLSEADQALYEAKRAGKGVHRHYSADGTSLADGTTEPGAEAVATLRNLLTQMQPAERRQA